MGFFKNKRKSKISVSPVTPRSAEFGHSEFASLPHLETKDKKYKRLIRILRFVSRFISVVLNSLIIGILAFALSKYYLTKDRVVGDKSVWITPATLWPSFMLLGIAVTTLLMNLITLCSYLCGIGAANKVDTAASLVSYILTGIHVAAWAVAAGLFKMANNGKDLWGYTCSSTADALEEQVKNYLNFGRLCDMQGWGWYVSIIQAASYLVAFVTTILICKRARQKKRIAKIRDSTAMELGYNHSHESGTIYQPGTGRRYMPVQG